LLSPTEEGTDSGELSNAPSPHSDNAHAMHINLPNEDYDHTVHSHTMSAGTVNSSEHRLDSSRLASEENEEMDEDDDAFDEDGDGDGEDLIDEDDDDGDSQIGDEPYDDDKREHTRKILETPTSITSDQLTRIFRPPPQMQVIKRITSRSDTNSPVVFPQGPSATRRHPWTSRQDSGINSRVKSESGADERGLEIYYCGVIDILQQYNASKKIENFFKVSYRAQTK
jgi:hypothetical protein